MKCPSFSTIAFGLVHFIKLSTPADRFSPTCKKNICTYICYFPVKNNECLYVDVCIHILTCIHVHVCLQDITMCFHYNTAQMLASFHEKEVCYLKCYVYEFDARGFNYPYFQPILFEYLAGPVRKQQLYINSSIYTWSYNNCIVILQCVHV